MSVCTSMFPSGRSWKVICLVRLEIVKDRCGSFNIKACTQINIDFFCKCKGMHAFCENFCMSGLWTSFTRRAYNSLWIQYNYVFEILMRLPPYCSTSGMFADLTISLRLCERRQGSWCCVCVVVTASVTQW